MNSCICYTKDIITYLLAFDSKIYIIESKTTLNNDTFFYKPILIYSERSKVFSYRCYLLSNVIIQIKLRPSIYDMKVS